MNHTSEIRLEAHGRGWVLTGDGANGFELANDYLGHLADRNYSPRTVRSYGLDLLAFCRWLASERIGFDAVTTDVLLRFLAFCRSAVVAGRPGGNVISIRDGRNAGYAPTTINRRMAAISGMYEFRSMRDPEAKSPMPKGKAATSSRGLRPGSRAPAGQHGFGRSGRGPTVARWPMS